MIAAGCALGALLIGRLVGTWWPALAAAAGLWGVAFLTRGIARLLLLLAAPIVLAVATPVDDVQPGPLAGTAILAVLALAPLLLDLGPARPRRRAGLIAAAALGVAAVFTLTPPGALLMGSDLAVGVLVVAMAGGLLAASTIPA